MKSTLIIAALFAATAASAQSTLTLPNNSAGTQLDTPPVLPSAPAAVEPGAAPKPAAPPSDAPRDFVIRDNSQQRTGPKEVDKVDKMDRKRPAGSELPRLPEAPAPLK